MSDIIAIGGSAFSAEPRNLALDRYILDTAGKPRPKVLFIPTATGDTDPYIAKFYAAYASLDAKPAALRHVLSEDARASGARHGAGRHLCRRRQHEEHARGLARVGAARVLKEALHTGTVLAGVSAGAICWFEQGVTDSWADRLATARLPRLRCRKLLPTLRRRG